MANKSHCPIIISLVTKRGLSAVLVALLFHAAVLFADVWDQNFEKGKLLLERGDWQLAIESIQIALTARPEPDHQATTSNLKLVEYLPYFYLGKAYFLSGDYGRALANFRKSAAAEAVHKTAHVMNLRKMIEMSEQLLEFNRAKANRSQQTQADQGFDVSVAQIERHLENEEFAQARIKINRVKQENPGDGRLAVLGKWFRDAQKHAVAREEAIVGENGVQGRYRQGLNFFIQGQYQQALRVFREVELQDPQLGAVKGWINRTLTEMERLRLDASEAKAEPPEPQIIERIITQTTAPVFAFRTPVNNVSDTRSAEIVISGQAGDDQGIASIEIALNGEPLLDADGEQVVIQPKADEHGKKFPFSTLVPLRLGENLIVLTAYDIDSPPHRTIEQFTVTRKPPIYKTAAFAISLGSFVLLGVGGLFISRRVKYRIAIINKYNPYIAGSPIMTEEMFFGREKLLKRILNTVHNNSLMIHGPRRIGKTSLQHLLKRRLENLDDPEFVFVPVMIDLQGTSEEHFFSHMMEEVIETCKPCFKGEIKFKLHENKDNYSGRDLSRDLKALLTELGKQFDKKLKLVLLIDEVDELNKYSEQVNQKLRSIFMKTFAQNLVAIMSGTSIRKSWESEGSPWYNFFEEIDVPPFEPEDAAKLITEPVAGIFSYDQDAVAKIIEYSECKPYVIQKFCVQVVNCIIEEKRRRVTVADVDAVARQVLTAVAQQAG